ncbi:hypothetical protein ACVMIX_005916 [Rhizobium leguminosarum]
MANSMIRGRSAGFSDAMSLSVAPLGTRSQYAKASYMRAVGGELQVYRQRMSSATKPTREFTPSLE